MVTIAVIGLFCVFMMCRVPLAASMLAASLVTLLAIGQIPLTVIPKYVVSGVTSFELLAVPFFILAAEIMNAGGITRRIFEGALMICGRLPGALAQVNVVASTIFAGISGAALADLAGLGRVEIKAMTENGYDIRFSSALALATCLMGALVPPSIVMVIFAVVAEQSVGRMLLAGLLPGLLAAFCLMLYVLWATKTGRVHCPPVPLPPWPQRLRAIGYALPAIFSPVVILFGIACGIVTPTEAAVAACAYSLIVAVFVYRELTFSRFVAALRRATLSSANIMFIVGAATVMSWLITWDQSASDLAAWFSGLSQPTWIKLLMVNGFLLIVGCFIEGVPALLILTPILLPAMTRIGVDPIHFGVILNFNLLIGILTPPMGIGLFVTSNMTKLSVESLAVAVLPFFVPLIAALMLVTFVPSISLLLPRILMP